MFSMDTYELNEVQEFECETCANTDDVKALVKSGETFAAMQAGKEHGESAWEPTNQGWICPECADRE